MKTMLMGLASLAIVVAGSATVQADGHAKDGWITQESANSVSVTADKLAAAVEKAGAKVFARVDHQAGAKSIGDELPGATLVIFGNLWISYEIFCNLQQSSSATLQSL